MAVTFPNRAQKPYSLDFITFTLHPRKLTNPKAVLTANKETEKKKMNAKRSKLTKANKNDPKQRKSRPVEGLEIATTQRRKNDDWHNNNECAEIGKKMFQKRNVQKVT